MIRLTTIGSPVNILVKMGGIEQSLNAMFNYFINPLLYDPKHSQGIVQQGVNVIYTAK